jgi:adenine-specific DNA-methyltransferase
LLAEVEQARIRIAKSTRAEHKSRLGQFFTPAATARFMAGLFPLAASPMECRLLDAGAGVGSLSGAFLERCAMGGLRFARIAATAYELDGRLLSELENTFSTYAGPAPLDRRIRHVDFIEDAVNRIQFGGDTFTHAILNPPYKKISGNSRHRLLLRQAGIETVNLYSAFLALTLAMMAPGGQVVAIVPRSFCNGPYYRPFREYLLRRAALRHLHLFASRSQAFRDDDVLQENIIVALERGAPQGDVTISTSTDDRFADLTTHIHPFDRVVHRDDPERFIHVPTSPEPDAIALAPAIHYSLDDIGVQVSTGPVVDFRLREFPGPGAVPLLYPGHLGGERARWPRPDLKKPNAIEHNAVTEKWLYPNGFYCAVRRFSAKEEKRRIVAGVVEPQTFGAATLLGFENHLNVFHARRQGLPEALARGLAAYLNTSAVDANFRRFNGHTQVNATDLRLMKYPSREALVALGEWAKHEAAMLDQTMLDERFSTLAA